MAIAERPCIGHHTLLGHQQADNQRDGHSESTMTNATETEKAKASLPSRRTKDYGAISAQGRSASQIAARSNNNSSA